MKASDEAKPLHIQASPSLTYNFAGTVNRVTPAQIETFGLELVNKDILKDVAPHADSGLLFYPTKQGLLLITRGSGRVSEPPRVVFTNDVLTRQRPLLKDKAAFTTLVKPSAAAKPRFVDKHKPVRLVKVNVSRAIQNIESVEALKLIALWENAHRILIDDQKSAQHDEVRMSIGVVTGPLIGSQKGPLPLVASGQRA